MKISLSFPRPLIGPADATTMPIQLSRLSRQLHGLPAIWASNQSQHGNAAEDQRRALPMLGGSEHRAAMFRLAVECAADLAAVMRCAVAGSRG
jgi:hypothetical protein